MPLHAKAHAVDVAERKGSADQWPVSGLDGGPQHPRGAGRNPDLLPGLRGTIGTATSIPLVFDSMALTWQEVTDLRTLIRANCTVVDSTEYRDNPAGHKYCPR